MIFLNNSAAQLDDLLDRMAQAIQLDETRYKRMTEAYEAVKKWIESDEKFFGPYKYDVYPHGSVRILTTVKPLSKEEFDLDVVIHLMSASLQHSPQRIYNELKRRLMEHGTYKSMVELKNRCVRLNYAGDFHMDIMPGVQQSSYDVNSLMVPDKKLGTWVISNPRGYAAWFLQLAASVKQSLLEKALRAENLPVDDYNNKKPLQVAVQLLKRYRDLYFAENDSDYRTSSIILTTIAGQFYQGEESIFDALSGIIKRVYAHARFASRRIQVVNPVNDAEDFTDKWEEDPRYFEAFKRFCKHLRDQLLTLAEKSDVITESRTLKGLFGPEVFAKAQQGQVLALEKLRSSRQLAVDRKTGTLTSAVAAISTSIPVKPNTFFGD